MADQFVKVTRNGCLSNIFGSFIGALLGIVLFFGSFIVLWTNEGRINMATVARTSVPVAAASVNASADGKLVALDGTLSSSETLGDNAMFKPDQYLELERKVEMYAWTERSSSETTKEIGGGSTTKKTYTYEREWTDSPSNSQNFEVSGGHQNPEKSIEDTTVKVSSATIGAYAIHPDAIELPDSKRIMLDREKLDLNQQEKIVNNYIFTGAGTLENPKVGDLRISYLGVPNNIQVTAFGKAQGSQLAPYVHSSGDQLYRAFDTNRDGAIKQMGDEYTALLWLLRTVGFFMMWLGLGLMLNPISAFANVIPMIGTLSGWLIAAATFVMAFGITVLTVVVAIIAHSVWLLLGLVVLLIVGGVMLGRMTQRQTPAPAMQ